MDDYLRSRLFGPLGIRDVSWTHDRTGNPYGMAGLRIHAADFAKIGQMMLWGGTWNGKRVVSEAWIDQSTQRPAQAFQPLSGLLWWLEAPNANVVIDQPFLDALRDRGADSVFIAKLEPLRDHRIPKAEFRDELRRALGSDAIAQWTKEAGQRRLEARTVVSGEYDGFSARGSYGQILLVYPSRDLVAVRFTTSLDPSDPTVGFSDFATLVRALAVPTTH
jgi:CubicO group peptidase (beta-lactamase class C family)